ncbi:hypothetical protein RRF57_010518 [Xylaria bambusicola]|uniref:Ubiquitin-like protease family profile domain-containing protein n=1 Tax=Xylaria bambusicola TaxID=326684 RepID=A0AAN7Z2T9_9PEZI
MEEKEEEEKSYLYIAEVEIGLRMAVPCQLGVVVQTGLWIPGQRDPECGLPFQVLAALNAGLRYLIIPVYWPMPDDHWSLVVFDTHSGTAILWDLGPGDFLDREWRREMTRV